MKIPAAAIEQNTSNPVLSVRNLVLSQPSSTPGQDRIALIKGIDLDLFAGEILGLVGESGCGKSLTAKALLGMLPAENVQLECDHFVYSGDQDLSRLNEKQWRSLRGGHLAMVFQEPQSALDPVFTVGQQLQRVIQRHLNLDRLASRNLASKTLEECGLADPERVLASYPHQLSGGMQQRVTIAMALACQANVLLVDEPTSALDMSSRDQVLGLLQNAARQRNTAVMMISHDLAAVARICDRLLVMYAGRLIETGPAEQVLAQPSHPYTAALIAATPHLSDPPIRLVRPIAGQVSRLDQQGEACAFANRCSRASEICKLDQPQWSATQHSNGQVACHHALPPSSGQIFR